MENVKDLTGKLQELELKDTFYRITATLQHLLAPQDPKTARPIIYVKAGWGGIERIESNIDGSAIGEGKGATPQTMTSPRRKTRVRKGEVETKTGLCWSFGLLDGGIVLPWGGSWGLFKSAWRRTLEAKADKYTNPKLDLMKVYPRALFVKGKIDSQAKDQEPHVILETRNTQRGKVMVEAFFDYINDRKTEFYVEVDSENPINEERSRSIVQSVGQIIEHAPNQPTIPAYTTHPSLRTTIERELPSKVCRDDKEFQHAGQLRSVETRRNPNRQDRSSQAYCGRTHNSQQLAITRAFVHSSEQARLQSTIQSFRRPVKPLPFIRSDTKGA